MFLPPNDARQARSAIVVAPSKGYSARGGAVCPPVLPSICAIEMLATVTVKAYEDVPLAGTVAGEMEQVEPVGVPVQLSDTVPLNPLIGVT